MASLPPEVFFGIVKGLSSEEVLAFTETKYGNVGIYCDPEFWPLLIRYSYNINAPSGTRRDYGFLYQAHQPYKGTSLMENPYFELIGLYDRHREIIEILMQKAIQAIKDDEEVGYYCLKGTPDKDYGIENLLFTARSRAEILLKLEYYIPMSEGGTFLARYMIGTKSYLFMPSGVTSNGTMIPAEKIVSHLLAVPFDGSTIAITENYLANRKSLGFIHRFTLVN